MKIHDGKGDIARYLVHRPRLHVWGFFPITESARRLPALSHRHASWWSVVVLAMLVARSQDWRELWQAARSRACSESTLRRGGDCPQLADVRLGRSTTRSCRLASDISSTRCSAWVGLLVFHERLRKLQWVSIALAAAGVFYLTVAQGAVPGSRCPCRVVWHLWRDEKDGPLGPGTGWRWKGHPLRPAAAFLIWRSSRARRACALRISARRDDGGSGPITTIRCPFAAACVRFH